MMKDRLLGNLSSIGMDIRLMPQPDGSELLVLPHGGRILGLFAPGSDANFLWTNPALRSPECARDFYASSDWHNSGGDRTWLAPEFDLFFPNRPGDGEDYFQPRQLDPGDYRADVKDGIITLTNKFTVTPFSAKLPIAAEITKSFLPAPNPLRYHVDSMGLEGIAYAGYTQRTSLTVLNPYSVGDARIGLWNLLQMPNGGEMLIPTFSRDTPAVYFGEIPAADLQVSDGLVRYRMRAQGGQKIGVRAAACMGRAGYLYQVGEEWALVIRNFAVNPSAEYVDLPWNQPASAEFVFQACNVNNDLGQFSELEYHAPAVGGSPDSARSDDVSQVWAFRGEQEGIIAVARRLLTSRI